MAFEYVGLDPCLKLVSAAFENPFGLEHLETAQQKRDQSKGGVQLGWTSVSLAPLSLATPHLSPHVSSQLSLSLHPLKCFSLTDLSLQSCHKMNKNTWILDSSNCIDNLIQQ